MKILLAVDGSEPSKRAAQKLVESVAWFREPPEIELLTVHLPLPRFGNMGAMISDDMVERHYAEESQAALAPARQGPRSGGLRFAVSKAVGQVAETIAEHATRHGADLIYMGTRGMTSLSGMVMGSITTRVVHLATVPVVLVR